MMLEIRDPLTNEVLEIYAQDHSTGEINRAYPKIAIQDIMRAQSVDETEAIRLLSNSDIDHCVSGNNTEYWSE